MAGHTRPIYKQLKYWVDNYGSAGISDQKAVETFIECENREMVTQLRNELTGVAQGNFDQDSLDKIANAKRRIKYNSYNEWAKLMLLWMAGYKG